MAAENTGYRTIRPIGGGAYGKVFLVENQAKTQFAKKVIKLKNIDDEAICWAEQEAHLLSRLRHEHILKFISAEKTEETLIIYTEYCPNGDLSGYIDSNRGQKMKERLLVEWVRQIASALQYLHNLPQKVIHRDLKSGNVFLDAEWNMKLGDFGVSRVIQSSTDIASSFAGTKVFIAPEVVYDTGYTEKVDIFSLGMVMYDMAMMYNSYFCHINPKILLYQIIRNETPTMPNGYSSDVTKLMKTMMHVDPDKRPSATNLLQHDVFKREPLVCSTLALKSRPEADTVNNVETVHDHAKDTDKTITPNENRPTPTVEEGQNEAGAVGGRTMEKVFSEDPMISYLTRILIRDKEQVPTGHSTQEKHAALLKMWCLKYRSEDEFNRTVRRLRAMHDEKDIAELCYSKYWYGILLLHYVIYTCEIENSTNSKMCRIL